VECGLTSPVLPRSSRFSRLGPKPAGFSPKLDEIGISRFGGGLRDL